MPCQGYTAAQQAASRRVSIQAVAETSVCTRNGGNCLCHSALMGASRFAVSAAAAALLALTAGCGGSTTASSTATPDSSHQQEAGLEGTEQPSAEQLRADDCALLMGLFERTQRDIEREFTTDTEGLTDKQKRGATLMNQRIAEESLLEWAAGAWPQMSDSDLKSVLREMSRGTNWDANMTALDSLCGFAP